MTIQIIILAFVIFQTYKNTVSIHLGGSFDCVFTLVYEKI